MSLNRTDSGLIQFSWEAGRISWFDADVEGVSVWDHIWDQDSVFKPGFYRLHLFTYLVLLGYKTERGPIMLLLMCVACSSSAAAECAQQRE